MQSAEHILTALTLILANQLAGKAPATEEKIREAASIIQSSNSNIMGLFGIRKF